MKSSEFRGTGEVFRFTLFQTIKSKAYIVSVLFMIVSIILVPIVMQVVQVSGEKQERTETGIEKAYVCNELDFLMPEDIEEVAKISSGVYSGVKIEVTDKNFEDAGKMLEEEGRKTKNVIVHLYVNEVKGINVEVVRVAEGVIDSSDCSDYAEALCENVDAYKNEKGKSKFGFTDDDVALLDTVYIVEAREIGENGELVKEEDTGIGGGQFGVIYAAIFVIGMMAIVASSQIATAVTTDKSSRVVELLLTSVRPSALLMGKILAMLVATVGQFAVMLVMAVVSNKVTGLLFDVKTTALANKIPSGILSNITLVNGIVSIVIMALGMLLYAALAGLCGAMVSKMEELPDALKYFTITSFVGMYLGLGAAIAMQSSSTSMFVKFSILFPLSSCMLVPGALLIGVTNLTYALIAIAILVVLDILVIRFAARVYEGLITNMGNRVTLKQVFAMARDKKKGGAQ